MRRCGDPRPANQGGAPPGENRRPEHFGPSERAHGPSLTCLSANAMPIRRGLTDSGLPRQGAVHGRPRELRWSLVPLPQNASTVHRGQLPTPGAWGGTERSGHNRAVPAERMECKEGLQGLCQYRTQIAGVRGPSGRHSAGEAAYPSDEAPLVSFVSDSPQRLRPPTSRRLDANSPSRGFSFRLTGWVCGPEHAGQ